MKDRILDFIREAEKDFRIHFGRRIGPEQHIVQNAEAVVERFLQEEDIARIISEEDYPYYWHLPTLLNVFMNWAANRAYCFIKGEPNHWYEFWRSERSLVDWYLDYYRRNDPHIRRFYVPVNLSYVETKLTNHAYACMSQNIESVYRIQEHLGRYDIDAVSFLTERGDYTDIHISFHESGKRSFDRYKQWFKVVEKARK